jgi:hypothetical protein
MPPKLIRRCRAARWFRLGLIGFTLGGTGCEFLPMSVQSRSAASRLGVDQAVIDAVVRRTCLRHGLEPHWVKRTGHDRLEIGMGHITSSLAVVVYRVDGRWEEDPRVKTISVNTSPPDYPNSPPVPN